MGKIIRVLNSSKDHKCNPSFGQKQCGKCKIRFSALFTICIFPEKCKGKKEKCLKTICTQIQK